MSTTRFVEVPAESIDSLLLGKGFVAGLQGNEKTYTRVGKDNPLLSIVVYSSVALGASTARGCGDDAIRVILVGEARKVNDVFHRSFCLHKTKKILRTGSVEKILDRVMDRVMEAAIASKKFGGPCEKCGSVTYRDSGRCLVRECREGQ